MSAVVVFRRESASGESPLCDSTKWEAHELGDESTDHLSQGPLEQIVHLDALVQVGDEDLPRREVRDLDDGPVLGEREQSLNLLTHDLERLPWLVIVGRRRLQEEHPLRSIGVDAVAATDAQRHMRGDKSALDLALSAIGQKHKMSEHLVVGGDCVGVLGQPGSGDAGALFKAGEEISQVAHSGGPNLLRMMESVSVAAWSTVTRAHHKPSMSVS